MFQHLDIVKIKGQDLFISEETGTGKSFGVMAEIVNRYYQYLKSIDNLNQHLNQKRNMIQLKKVVNKKHLEQEKEDDEAEENKEKEEEEEEQTTISLKPKYIIVSPNRELAWQFGYWIRDLLKRLGDGEKFQGVKDLNRIYNKIQLVIAGIPKDVLHQELMNSDPDIIIGTPNTLYELFITGSIDLHSLEFLFIDEADQLFKVLTENTTFKAKQNRKKHPLIGSLLFDEIKRRCRELNFVERRSTIQDFLNAKLRKGEDGSELLSLPYKRTLRPFQTVFTSATLNLVTRNYIDNHDWINPNYFWINTNDQKHPEKYQQQQEENSIGVESVLSRLNHYFISADTEQDMLNAIVDVWKHMKPKKAIGIIANDGNVTRVVSKLTQRNINTKPLTDYMDFDQFNIEHLSDKDAKQSLQKSINIENYKKSQMIKREMRERTVKRNEEAKKEQQRQSQKMSKEDKQLLKDGEGLVEKDLTLEKGECTGEFFISKEDAIRGIDIQDVTHVFILNVTISKGSYLHMAGRTGRMGKNGTVVSIYNASLSVKYTSTALQLEIPFHEDTYS
eukprot:gene1342-1695_t